MQKAPFTPKKRRAMSLKSRFMEPSGYLMTGCVLSAMFEVGGLMIPDERDHT